MITVRGEGGDASMFSCLRLLMYSADDTKEALTSSKTTKAKRYEAISKLRPELEQNN